MKQTPQRSLAEMARDALGGSRVSCPKCGCEDFRTYGGRDGEHVRIRYKKCRNCDHRIVTTTTERIIRDVDQYDKQGDKDSTC